MPTVTFQVLAALYVINEAGQRGARFFIVAVTTLHGGQGEKKGQNNLHKQDRPQGLLVQIVLSQHSSTVLSSPVLRPLRLGAAGHGKEALLLESLHLRRCRCCCYRPVAHPAVIWMAPCGQRLGHCSFLQWDLRWAWAWALEFDCARGLTHFPRACEE